VRIEDTADVLRSGAGLDRADVVALVEFLEVELLDGPGSPQAQRVDGLRSVARNGSVERRGQHVARVHPLVGQTAPVVHEFPNAAEEAHAETVAGTGNLPRIAVAEPGVGHLHLASADDPLVKDSIIVAEPISVRRVAEGGQRIEKAGGQTAQATVAEPGVPFRLAEI